MPKILVIDDDRFLAEAVRKLLTESGFEVTTAASAMEAWTELTACKPDVIVLDLGLPDQDGLTLCRQFRGKTSVPILMLTSRSAAVDKVLGLEFGADDYLTKPFDSHELVARIRALLRRRDVYDCEPEDKSYSLGGVRLNMGSRRATINGISITLTETELKLLEYLMANPGRALERDTLFTNVWGYDSEFNSNSLEVMVYRLRNKIKVAGGSMVIRTLRGYGYVAESGL